MLLLYNVIQVLLFLIQRGAKGFLFVRVNNGQYKRKKLVRRVDKIKRVRQHLNPLSYESQKPIELDEDWFFKAFDVSDRHLIVDVGSAMGGWCIESANQDPETNFLGLEIRNGCHKNALMRLDAAQLEQKNCFFLQANANVDLERILRDVLVSGARVEAICFQFPDPHFKKRHHKRRVVTPQLARVVEEALLASSSYFSHDIEKPFVYMASDVLEAAEHMRSVFRNETNYLIEKKEENKDGGVSGDYEELDWTLEYSPFPVQTERESAVLAGLGETSTKKQTIYRALFHL
mmetsp:Transcript_17419/g.22670  ORF Transcript_17419/g.22670 Transcript_17419/m.22670 type:complete len:290 (+) Transcript_17419:166-1035(+)